MTWSHWAGHEAMPPEEWALRDARHRIKNLERDLVDARAANARQRREIADLRRALTIEGIPLAVPRYITAEEAIARALAEQALQKK